MYYLLDKGIYIYSYIVISLSGMISIFVSLYTLQLGVMVWIIFIYEHVIKLGARLMMREKGDTYQ